MRFGWILFLLLPLVVSGADITGKWIFTVELDAGSGSPTFVFQQQGEKLSGRYQGQLGEADLSGTVKGDDIEFRFTIKSDAGEIEATYTGKISGQSMKGKAVYGNLASGTFTAKRAG